MKAGRSVPEWIGATPDTPVPPRVRLRVFADYEEVLADHRRLVREMDVALNGDGAARQASLCDLVGQVKAIAALNQRPDPAPVREDVVERACATFRDTLIVPESWDAMRRHAPSLADEWREAMRAALAELSAAPPVGQQP